MDGWMDGWMDGQWMQRECERRELIWPNHGFYPNSEHWVDLKRYRINSRDGIGRRQLPNGCHNAMEGGSHLVCHDPILFCHEAKGIVLRKISLYLASKTLCVQEAMRIKQTGGVPCLRIGRSHRLPWANPVLPWEAASTAMRPEWGWAGVGLGGPGETAMKTLR